MALNFKIFETFFYLIFLRAEKCNHFLVMFRRLEDFFELQNKYFVEALCIASLHARASKSNGLGALIDLF